MDNYICDGDDDCWTTSDLTIFHQIWAFKLHWIRQNSFLWLQRCLISSVKFNFLLAWLLPIEKDTAPAVINTFPAMTHICVIIYKFRTSPTF